MVDVLTNNPANNYKGIITAGAMKVAVARSGELALIARPKLAPH